MKLKACLVSLLFISILASAQYEQLMSITLSAGTFNTFGYKYGDVEAMQMPNYGVGLSANGGLQFRINERLSLLAEIGIMLTRSWSYIDSDGNNYMYWSIRDTVSNELMAEGENYLDLVNYSFSLKPKYYLLQGKKWNPYLFVGININLTSAYFEDQGWMELEKRNLLPPDDTGPSDGFLETNTGLGFNPGAGVEYKLSEKLYLNLSAGYYFIALSKDNFKIPTREEHFHSLILQVGMRIYFIKTKDL